MSDLSLCEVSTEDPELVLAVAPESDESALVSLVLSCPIALVTHVVLRARSTKDLSCRLVLVDFKTADSQTFQPVKHLQVPREEDRLDMEYADGVLHFPTVCVTAALRLTFQCDRPEWDDLDMEVAAISNRLNQDRHWAERIFRDTYASAGVLGHSLLATPEASHSLGLINLVQVLADHEEAREACYLAGLALISERKSTQAAEFLRRAESLALKGVNLQKTAVTTSQRPINTVVSLKIWYAVRLEIIIADGFALGGLYKQQVLAWQRAVELQQGGTVIANCSGSAVACVSRLNPILTRILMKCLSDPAEPIRVAALRSLRVVVELVGCSLGSAVATILKAVVRAYHIHPSGQSDLFNNSTLTNISFTEIIFKDDAPLGSANEYLKLIQSIRNLLPDCGFHLLQKLFAEAITPLIMMDIKKDLKYEILKLAERIAEIMQGDLEVDLAVLKHVFALRDSEDFQEAATSLWTVFTRTVLPHYSGSDLGSLLEWLRETLAPDNSLETATETLQLLTSIAHNVSTLKPELARMKSSLDHWLHFSLTVPGQLQLYQQVWTCLAALAPHIPRFDLTKIIQPVLDKTDLMMRQVGIQSETLQFLKITLMEIHCKEPIVRVLNSILTALFVGFPSRYESQLLEVLILMLGKLGVQLHPDTLKTAAEALFDDQIPVSDTLTKARSELLQICLSPGLLESAIQLSLLDTVPNTPPQPSLLSFSSALLEKCGSAQLPALFSLAEQLCNACDLLLANEDPGLKTTSIRYLRALVRVGASGKVSDRIDTAMLVLGSLKAVLEVESDVDMLFLGLQLLYQVFTELIPTSDKRYMEFRASETVKLWQIVTKCVESGWTKIAMYAGALLRNWAWNCSAKVSKKLIPYILSLANAKDCFRRDLFLSVLANLLGMGTISVTVPSAIWEGVFPLQQDWNPDIRSKAKALMLRCAPKETAKELTSRQQQKNALLAESSQYDFLTYDEDDESTCDFPLKDDSIPTPLPDLTVLFKSPQLPASLRDGKEQNSCVKTETTDLKVDLNELPELTETKNTVEIQVARKEEKPQPPPELKLEESRIRAVTKQTEDLPPALALRDTKRSPRTPRKSLEQELDLALRPQAGVPPHELMTKIYLQRPDMTQFRRKTKSASLTNSAGRTRKVTARLQRPSPVFKEH